MGFQLRLLSFLVFLVLTLSFCQAKNATLKVIGSILLSNSQASYGVDVFIRCKLKNREVKTQGNSPIDKQGKFNITLSTETTEDIHDCFAKLQPASINGAAPCPLQAPQTVSLQLLNTQNATQTPYNKPTTIDFSPITCESAFFWPLPNITFFPEYVPPSPEDFPPVQPPLPPPAPSVPPPTSAPAPAPNPTTRNPSPPPLQIHNPPIPPPTPMFQNSIPPIQPKKHENPQFKTPIASPTPAFSPQSPHSENLTPPSPPSPIAKKPRFIPRAPPVPSLPSIPQAPRKYFNSPKSKSKPPHS